MGVGARILKTQRGLHGAAFVLALSTIASQLLALVRDRLLAGTFGAGEFLDVYYAAFRVPDFLFVSVASLFSAAVIIPFFVSRLEHDQDQDQFFSSLLQSFLAIMGVVLLVVFALMPVIAPYVAPGISGENQELLVLFSRILLLSPLLLGISSILSGAVQALRYFLLFSLAPLLYNIGIIVGITVLYPAMGSTGIVWGVVLGALMHVGIQLPVIFKHKLIVPTKDIVKTTLPVLYTSVPRTLALSMTQLQIIVFTGIASLFAAGSIASFQFGFNLQSIPLSLVGVSYSIAAFPALSTWWAKGKYLEFIGVVRRAEGHVILWSLLLSALFIFLRQDIVEVVLGVGAFGETDATLVASVLGVFAISLAPQGLVLLYSRAWYAMHETRIPLIANGGGALMAVILAMRLPDRFAAQGLPELLGLPAAFSIGVIFSAVLLSFWYERKIGTLSSLWIWLHGTLGLVLLYLTLIFIKPIYLSIVGQGAPWQQFLVALFAGVDAAGVAVIYWYAVGLKPARDLVSGIYRRIRD